MRRVGGAVVAGALMAGLLTSIASPPRSEAGVGSVSDPATPPGVAFTDDRDEQRQSTVTRTGTAPSATIDVEASELVSDRAADHSGEASSDGAGDFAFVSTAGDDPEGEVWIDDATSSSSPEQVTCNDAVETHPVLSIVGRSRKPLRFEVLFASNADGDWDIWEATQTPGQPSPSTPPGCARWTTVNLTGPGPDDNQDLWPSFSPDGDGIIFSRSGPKDPLGDIYVGSFGCACGRALRPLSAIFPIIEDPESADTQPNVAALTNTNGKREIWLAWTRTKTRPEGTVALTEFNPLDGEPSYERPYDVYEPFPAGTSEPAWGGIYTDRYVAYTSNEIDPYGDVRLAQLTQPTPGLPETDESPEVVPIPPTVSSTEIVSGEPGVAESHASGMTPFVAGKPGSYSAEVRFTRESLDADITGVPQDGSGKRTDVAHGTNSPGGGSAPLDQAGPSFAPDGQHVVYSQAQAGENGRRLVIADADGSRPRYLDAGRQNDDIDVDPAWSPDGKHVAFTRYEADSGRWDNPVVWAVDLSPALIESNPRQITRQPRAPSTYYADVHPSWSPDSSKVVVARGKQEGVSFAASTGGRPPLVSRAQPVKVPNAGLTTQLWVLDAVAAGPDQPVLLPPACGQCAAQRVAARTPSWSPDGRTIAYEALGALQTLRLAAEPADGVWLADDHRSVTGFERADQTGQPTASRSTVSVAEEPVWSPDGSEIAFTGQPAGQPRQRGIWAIKPDGTGLRLLTDLHLGEPARQDDERGPDTEPTWQPMGGGADLVLSIVLTGGSPLYVGAPRPATLTVVNRGPVAAENVVLKATYPATGVTPTSKEACLVPTTTTPACAIGTLQAGGRRAFQVTLMPTAAATGTLAASVTADTSDPDLANNKASLPIVVLQPTIRLLPAVARPGMVVLAYGESMPPGSKVRLTWDRGVTADPGPYTVAKDGTLRAGMLIVRRDRVGDRLLVATSVDSRFTPVNGSLLVALRVLDTGLWSRG